MAALITSNFNMPEEYVAGVFKKAQTSSVLARLSGAKPQKFGKGNVMTLTSAPKAEIVAEGAQKSPTPTAYSSKTVTPVKLQSPSAAPSTSSESTRPTPSPAPPRPPSPRASPTPRPPRSSPGPSTTRPSRRPRAS